jgi:hypothetical protein
MFRLYHTATAAGATAATVAKFARATEDIAAAAAEDSATKPSFGGVRTTAGNICLQTLGHTFDLGVRCPPGGWAILLL